MKLKFSHSAMLFSIIQRRSAPLSKTFSSSCERVVPINKVSEVAAAGPDNPVKEKSVFEDSYGRLHTYLRISLTERCNLRCGYCMPENGISLTPKSHLLTTDEILRLAKLFVDHGVTKIRLTGGEPTVHKDLKYIIYSLNHLKRVNKIAITTNGITLLRCLSELQYAGLNALNVSLDTLQEKKFEAITRRKGWWKVMAGIDYALQMGFNPVKVNCVIMKDLNDDEILDFVELTREKNIHIRFIEYMPFGGNKWHLTKMVPYSALVTSIRKKYPEFYPVESDFNETSKLYAIPGFIGRVGFISSISDNFCGSCNRLRLLADGSLKVCLLGSAEISLRDALRSGCQEDDLLALINAAILRKKRQHAADSTKYFRETNSAPLLSRNPSSSSVRMRLCHTLTHVNESGKATMVDVGTKQVTARVAQASAKIRVGLEIARIIRNNEVKKGDVLCIAKIAGIMAAKKTHVLIPLCHNVAISFIDLQLRLEGEHVHIVAEVRCSGQTGVEMEALTAASVAALTIYDMCKAMSLDIVIEEVKLFQKSGGKRDFRRTT